MNNRYYSLDVFRGATVALMILVNNPGSWSYIYPPFEHASWHGCTPTDMVFPFFLFAVGNAMAFVIPRLEQAGTPGALGKFFKRMLSIFVIGLLLNWAPFFKWEGDSLVFKAWQNIRIMGVLQRIALCYFFASLIVFWGKTKGALLISSILLLVYWMLCFMLGDPSAPYSLSGYFGTSIDKMVLGVSHLYKGEGVPFDPEGLSGTLPAISQVILGYFVGQFILKQSASPKSVLILLAAGFSLVAIGLGWSVVFPLNKKIWTSSYVLYTTGCATIILAALIYLIELKCKKGWLSKFFDVFGKNPLFIFVLSGLLPRLLGLIRISAGGSEASNHSYTTPLSWVYKHVCEPLFSNPKSSSLFYAVLMVLFYWLVAFVLDKRKIYIKV